VWDTGVGPMYERSIISRRERENQIHHTLSRCGCNCGVSSNLVPINPNTSSSSSGMNQSKESNRIEPIASAAKNHQSNREGEEGNRDNSCLCSCVDL
jgi:hypothetical protein